MSFSKKVRQQVYEKYDGHCAYCGKEIGLSEMQVDHLIPQRPFVREYSPEKVNAFENLMPSCRRCNHYKRANPLELFRQYIEEIPRKLKENYIYKVGLDYGLVEEHTQKIVFYFERNHISAKILICEVTTNET